MVHVAHRCRLLLEELYKLSRKSRLDEQLLFPEQVSAILHLDLDGTTAIVNSLEESGYIKCGRPFGKAFSWVKLTSKGMELLFLDSSESGQAFGEESPTAMPRGNNRDKVLNGTESVSLRENGSVSAEILMEIKQSLFHVVEALEKKDDEPLREFLAKLILEGGLETTLVGVKALLSLHGAEI
ncbi:hypothetical protein LLE49_06415 [Alicyclobacillus tolerans]|uniref:hypothetical protein n=1 Tax=Alicyclobacillus tolerans TaxID=90970 RepID=UPI001F4872FF|nr:hypothetical protein [Alicyclobacillus tolerans]MCF8564378.1 hypothetical protein [Alicyclobacillus tolerans]